MVRAGPMLAPVSGTRRKAGRRDGAVTRLADNRKPAQRLGPPPGIIAGCAGIAPGEAGCTAQRGRFGPPSALRSHTPPL
jgi:hypothetical protein